MTNFTLTKTFLSLMQTLFILYNTHHPSDYPPSLLANARWKPVLIQPKKSQTALFPLPQVSLALTSPHPFHSLPSNIRKSSALNLNPSTSHSAWILSLLILSGDIETNPGPPPQNTLVVYAPAPVGFPNPPSSVTHATLGSIKNASKLTLLAGNP